LVEPPASGRERLVEFRARDCALAEIIKRMDSAV
jgi:hypothetical protein